MYLSHTSEPAVKTSKSKWPEIDLVSCHQDEFKACEVSFLRDSFDHELLVKGGDNDVSLEMIF